jgi:chemotaxis protein MotB
LPNCGTPFGNFDQTFIVMRKLSNVLAALFIIISITSCISPKKVNEIKDDFLKSEEERKYLKSENQRLETENKEQSASIEQISKSLKTLSEDTTTLGLELRRKVKEYDRVNKLNDQLLKKQAESSQLTEAENRKLLYELQTAQENLQNKEDALRDLERELDAKKSNLDKLSSALSEREKRVNELEAIIAEKDARVKDLKNKVSNALLNFKDKGLTVEQKNGRIYVSMEAKLLFPSGSTTVNPEGKEALVDLAKVLEKQENITVLVEGHTDIDAYRGSGQIKDNWDLSVMRSTSVVKLMLENSTLDPTMLTAAGRGEFMPLDPAKTAEAKAKNRRIEIILTPNLDQLFEILDKASATEE